MTRALVVGAAPARDSEPFYRRLLAEPGLVVAADAAGEWCVSMGRIPDATVGDFDSATPGAAERLRALGSIVQTAPSTKDESDLDLCVRYARAQGASRIALTACTADRLDHTLAALGVVMRAGDLRAEVLEPGSHVWTVGGGGPAELEVDLPPGTTFSVIAPAGAAGVCIRGARYPLSDAVLVPLSDLGLSNVAVSSPVAVSVAQGALLVLALAPDRS